MSTCARIHPEKRQMPFFLCQSLFDFTLWAVAPSSMTSACVRVWQSPFITQENVLTPWDCNKAGYMTIPVACGWAWVVMEVIEVFGQELWAQNAQKRQNSNSRNSVRWSAVLVPCLSRLWLKLRTDQGSSLNGVDDMGKFLLLLLLRLAQIPVSRSNSRSKSQTFGSNPSLETEI